MHFSFFLLNEIYTGSLDSFLPGYRPPVKVSEARSHGSDKQETGNYHKWGTVTGAGARNAQPGLLGRI